MNPAEFRQNTEFVKQAHDTLHSGFVQLMLSTIEEMSPSMVALPDGPTTTPHDMIRHLGQVEGWNMFRRLLLSLGQPIPKITQPEVRYGAPKPKE